MKRKQILIITAVFVGIGIIGCGLQKLNYEFKKRQFYNNMYITFWDETGMVEYGSDPNIVHTNVMIKNNALVSHITELDTYKLGCQTVTYTLENHGKYGPLKKEQQFAYCVFDTQLPVIEFYEDVVTVKKGTIIDLEKNIKSVYDPVDGDLKYRVEGYYDKRWPADYRIYVSATDKSGYRNGNSYTIRVVE